MKCERARETVILLFLYELLVVVGVGERGRVGFALDISLIPGHGSLFVSRREEYMCTRVCTLYKGRGNARVCVCVDEVGEQRGGGIQKKVYIYICTLRRVYNSQCV